MLTQPFLSSLCTAHTDKGLLRPVYNRRRAGLPASYRAYAAAQVCALLLRKLPQGLHILAYQAIGAELNVAAFLQAARVRGAQVASLSQRASAAEIGRHSAVDVILCPGVAFSRTGVRLGRGGGHYDQVLSAWRPTPLTIGVGYRCQLVSLLPCEPWDWPMDAVVTERGLVWSPRATLRWRKAQILRCLSAAGKRR